MTCGRLYLEVPESGVTLAKNICADCEDKFRMRTMATAKTKKRK